MGHDKHVQPTQATPKSRTDGVDEVEGEGSYSATHRYNEGLKQSVERGDAERLGNEAKRALEGEEGPSLREAEKSAKHGKKAKTPAN